MSFFDRIMSIFRGSANKAMSKLETPEILAEQASIELEKNVKDLTAAVTSALTMKKQLEASIEKDKAELSTWEKRATMAVQANNDDIAKQCLERKQQHKQNIESMTKQLEEQSKTLDSLKRQHAEAEEKLRQFNIKKQGMIARAKAAENQAKANEIMSSAGGGGTSMDKLEQKIRDKEISNEAVAELSGKGKLDDQFKQFDKAIEVEDELAAIKAKVAEKAAPAAIGTSDVKLIVARDGSGQPVVDENLPMVVDVEVSETDEKGK